MIEDFFMAAVIDRLSLAEFHLKYGHSDRAYEYWHGKAIPKAMPTWIHGFLQTLIGRLLSDGGYKAGSEVDLRIDMDAIPRPDVIATRGRLEHPYPTKAVEVVVEILSPDDPMPYLLQKCAAYKEWGFEFIYVVDPENRKVYRWTDQGLEVTTTLASIPVDRIWNALDEAIR
jgi:Uma2 family endonuclease